jgi:hypothetical protein
MGLVVLIGIGGIILPPGMLLSGRDLGILEHMEDGGEEMVGISFHEVLPIDLKLPA